MAAVAVRRITEDEARRSQAEILRLVRMDRDRFLAYAHAYKLNAHQRGLAQEYERLDFLLGHLK